MRSTLRWGAIVALAITLMVSAGCADSNPLPAPTTSSTSASAAPSTSASTTAAFPRWTANSDYKTYSKSAVSYLAKLTAELGAPADPKKLAFKFYAAGEEPKEINCGDDTFINLETSITHIAFCGGRMVVFATGFQKVSDENQIIHSFTWAIADAMGGGGNEARTTCFIGALSAVYADKKETVLDIAATHMHLTYQSDPQFVKGRQGGVKTCW